MILNLENPKFTREEVVSAYDKFFEANDPAKGGSFYLQSKIFRARETLEEVLAEREFLEQQQKAAGGADKKQ